MKSLQHDASRISRKTSTALAGGMLALCLAVPPAYAAPPVTTAGPVNIIAQITIQPGSAENNILVKLIPKGFHLVIQTASYFRTGAAAGSISNLFLQTKFAGDQGYVALPESVADGSVYPSATLAATAYCASQTDLIANVYRSGSTTAAETDDIIIVGTYVQDPT